MWHRDSFSWVHKWCFLHSSYNCNATLLNFLKLRNCVSSTPGAVVKTIMTLIRMLSSNISTTPYVIVTPPAWIHVLMNYFSFTPDVVIVLPLHGNQRCICNYTLYIVKIKEALRHDRLNIMHPIPCSADSCRNLLMIV